MNDPSNDLVAAIKNYTNILIVVKGSPDPDAIASSYALNAICHKLGVSSAIIMTQKLSLPQNRAFIKLLKMPVSIARPGMDITGFDAFMVADYQSPSVSEITGPLPCAVFIDHHESDEKEIKADFILKNTEAGATSSLVALLLKNLPLRLDDNVMKEVSTALLYGIYSDTDKYSHAGTIDYEALEYISKCADNALFHRISSIPLSKKTMHMLSVAINKKIVYKDWLITGIGYIDENHRDSIAIVADFLLKREKCAAVIVFAAVEGDDRKSLTLDASFRSGSPDVNLNGIIKSITSQGGARKYKGAYQINLDYFSECPDRGVLWHVIVTTTVDLITSRRDLMFVTGIKRFFKKFYII